MISMRTPLVALAATACSIHSPERVGQRRAQLDAIADTCGLPRSFFKLRSLDDLRFRPSLDTEYEAVDCALEQLRKADFPMQMGFVGSEAPAEANAD